MNSYKAITRFFLFISIGFFPLFQEKISNSETTDREAVANEVLAMLVASFSCDGIITEDNLERLKRQANPRNATAAIEIIPDLLRNEKEMDLWRVSHI